MTMTTTDHADSGEIPRLVGEDRTVIIRTDAYLRRDTTDEQTQNLAHEMAGLPPRRRPAADETARMRLIEPALGLNHHDMAHRVIEIDDTVTIGLAGPQSPPPPLPPAPRPAAPGKYDPESLLDAVPPRPGQPQPRPQPTGPVPHPPPPAADETQVHTILDSLDGGRADLDGFLRPVGYVGRHRDPQDRVAVAGQRQWELLTEAAKPGGEPRRWRVLVGVGAFIALFFGVSFAVLKVFW